MGCGSSTRIKATVDDAYRPAPASFAVFNINAIEEPWMVVDHAPQEHQEKPSHVPTPILEKLSTFEADAPHTWDEVSKALQLDDLKKPPPLAASAKPETEPLRTPAHDSTPPTKNTPRKSRSFHTVDELDAKVSSKKPTAIATPAKSETKPLSSNPENNAPRKSLSFHAPELNRTESNRAVSEDFKPTPLRENIFILKDRLERQKGEPKKDPLSEFPARCPLDGGADKVVLYTTSLRGVRRTYEDCSRARAVMEGHGVVYEERDVSLHGEYLNELRELLNDESLTLPRVFVKGRYIGGVEQLVELNESGRLGRILGLARVERGVVRQACEGCGGKRFVPCLECGGSCKLVKSGLEKERCGQCNENGLVYCPACK
jgi:glutaredoxin domain-containing cysteine-rich protein 1